MNSARDWQGTGTTHSLEEQASWFARLTFHWVSPMIRKGSLHPLGVNDLLDLHSDQSTLPWSEKFGTEFQKQMLNSSANRLQKRFLLSSVLFELYRRKYIMVLGIALASAALTTAVPLVIQRFLQEFSLVQKSNTQLWLLALMVVCFPPLANMTMHHLYHITLKMGMNIRSALVTSIYQKSLKLNHLARARTSSGEIVNLMSVDAANIYQMSSIIYQFVIAPLQLLAGAVLLFNVLGYSAVVGLIAMISMIPLSILISKKIGIKKRELVGKADRRVSLMNEVLQGIRAIKFYSWEQSFLTKILEMKFSEKLDLSRLAKLGTYSTLLFLTTPFLAAASSFSAYVFLGKELNAPVVFSSLAIFGILKNTLGQLPHLFASFVNARISSQRFCQFMSLPELSESFEPTGLLLKNKGTVRFQNAHAQWGEKPTLSDLNFSIEPGELVAIVGALGSGKSSILQLILQELKESSGAVSAVGDISYASQVPWIRNASIRDNILFFRPFDEQKYRAVLESCDLIADLQSLEASDLTEIGERGVNLSGGQKQRVSLARALYSDSDIFLFDETFSALDHHVGLRVFENGLLKQLHNKTRIFVTHRFEFLPKAHRILHMKDGKVTESGTLEKLLALNGDFAQLWQTSQMAKGTSQVQTTFLEKAAKWDLHAAQPLSRIVLDEERNTGSVKSDLFKMYLRLSSPYGLIKFLVAVFLLREILTAGADIWLSLWSAKSSTDNSVNKLGGYLLIGICAAFATYFRGLVTWMGCLRAANSLHERLVDRILKAPLSFFDSTPVGRILNRFGKDIESVDQYLPNTLIESLGCLFTIVSTFVIIGISNQTAILLFVPISIVYLKVQALFRKSSREAKRLENVSRSPLFAHFSESLHGASVIRSFGAQNSFFSEAVRRFEGNQMAFYTIISLNRWLGIRLEFLGAAVISSCAFFAVLRPQDFNPGLVGLSLTASFLVTGVLNWAVRMASDVESSLNSVERIQEYSEIDVEKWEGNEAPKGWPTQADLSFENVTMRYRSQGRAVLTGVSFSIKPGEFVGVIGRTGAGKSSLLAALFRLTEIESGQIVLSGQDISKLKLKTLRQQITIIPQDPVLFMGTLRKNLDPFQNMSDESLNDAIERVGLSERWKLDSVVHENGGNLSVGQRQLVCLARALLEPSLVVVMDEATSNVDPETDTKIGRIIREEFKGKTILMIAHRLSTVETADKILQLNMGQVVAFGPPREVLKSFTDGI